MDAKSQLQSQWRNPTDILSLLLIIGGDVVQRAIAQLFGVYAQPYRGGPKFYLTPCSLLLWLGWLCFHVTGLSYWR